MSFQKVLANTVPCDVSPVTVNVVPEPATATLTLLAGGIFFCMRRIRAHYKQI